MRDRALAEGPLLLAFLCAKYACALTGLTLSIGRESCAKIKRCSRYLRKLLFALSPL
jgi:hypothetical protein